MLDARENPELTLPFPPKELNPNKRLHWTAKAAVTKRYRAECALLTRASGVSVAHIEGDIHVWIDIYPPDLRKRDDDNLMASCKSLGDGIADALGVNDRRFRPHPFVFRESPIKGGAVKVRFTSGPDQPKQD